MYFACLIKAVKELSKKQLLKENQELREENARLRQEVELLRQKKGLAHPARVWPLEREAGRQPARSFFDGSGERTGKSRRLLSGGG
jgi:cell division protein FtsB